MKIPSPKLSCNSWRSHSGNPLWHPSRQWAMWQDWPLKEMLLLGWRTAFQYSFSIFISPWLISKSTCSHPGWYPVPELEPSQNKKCWKHQSKLHSAAGFSSPGLGTLPYIWEKPLEAPLLSSPVKMKMSIFLYLTGRTSALGNMVQHCACNAFTWNHRGVKMELYWRAPEINLSQYLELLSY